jgi:hypothetical protein
MEKENKVTAADFDSLAKLIHDVMDAVREEEDSVYMPKNIKDAVGVKSVRECVDRVSDTQQALWDKFYSIRFRLFSPM